MRKELLIFALKILQDECRAHDFCSGCPISDKEGNCVLKNNIPSYLDIDQHLDDEIENLNL